MDLRDFATKQIELIEAEKNADIESTFTLQSRYSPIQLQRMGLAICGLSVSGLRSGLGGKFCVDFERDLGDQLPAHSFRNGDIVSVRDQTSDQSGVVYKVTDQVLTVAFSEEFKDTGSRQSVFKMANNITYQRMKDTMMTLINTKKENNDVVRVLMNASKPTFGDSQSDLVFFNDSELNEAQKEAVRFSLSANQVALIHGPPGTGKTFTCVEVIRQLVKRGDRVLVCGPSNLSVGMFYSIILDNVVERLAKTRLNIVRIGHPARILPAVLEHSLDILLKTCDQGQIVTDVRVEMDNTLNAIKKSKKSGERRALYQDIKHLRGELRTREKSAIQSLLKNAHVVLCTLNGAASKVLANEEFDTLLVDEASQALEAETWIPILKCKRVIFAGDHMQLPPTVKSSKIVKTSDKKSMKLEVTLIDRLVKMYGDSIKKLLNIQYRMNEHIMKFSSDQFYEGKLVAHESVKSRKLIDFPNIVKCEETETPLIFLDTTGANYMESVDNSNLGMKLDESKCNEGEANMILGYIKRLKNWGIQDEDIAIISPYNAQVDLLKLSLREESPLIEIGTVDGFQGREKLVIIISLVRSNDDFEIGFLRESRRLNVALTRAKCHLVVVCNGEFMISSKDKVLKKMVEFMEEHALIEYAQ